MAKERRVRTPEGAEKFGQAINDVIRTDKGGKAARVLARLGEQLSLFGDGDQATLTTPKKPATTPVKAAKKAPARKSTPKPSNPTPPKPAAQSKPKAAAPKAAVPKPVEKTPSSTSSAGVRAATLKYNKEYEGAAEDIARGTPEINVRVDNVDGGGWRLRAVATPGVRTPEGVFIGAEAHAPFEFTRRDGRAADTDLARSAVRSRLAYDDDIPVTYSRAGSAKPAYDGGTGTSSIPSTGASEETLRRMRERLAASTPDMPPARPERRDAPQISDEQNEANLRSLRERLQASTPEMPPVRIDGRGSAPTREALHTVEIGGRLFTRGSRSRTYTHARWVDTGDGPRVVSWHQSEAAAARTNGGQTTEQRNAWARVPNGMVSVERHENLTRAQRAEFTDRERREYNEARARPAQTPPVAPATPAPESRPGESINVANIRAGDHILFGQTPVKVHSITRSNRAGQRTAIVQQVDNEGIDRDRVRINLGARSGDLRLLRRDDRPAVTPAPLVSERNPDTLFGEIRSRITDNFTAARRENISSQQRLAAVDAGLETARTGLEQLRNARATTTTPEFQRAYDRHIEALTDRLQAFETVRSQITNYMASSPANRRTRAQSAPAAPATTPADVSSAPRLGLTEGNGTVRVQGWGEMPGVYPGLLRTGDVVAFNGGVEGRVISTRGTNRTNPARGMVEIKFQDGSTKRIRRTTLVPIVSRGPAQERYISEEEQAKRRPQRETAPATSTPAPATEMTSAQILDAVRRGEITSARALEIRTEQLVARQAATSATTVAPSSTRPTGATASALRAGDRIQWDGSDWVVAATNGGQRGTNTNVSVILRKEDNSQTRTAFFGASQIIQRYPSGRQVTPAASSPQLPRDAAAVQRRIAETAGMTETRTRNSSVQPGDVLVSRDTGQGTSVVTGVRTVGVMTAFDVMTRSGSVDTVSYFSTESVLVRREGSSRPVAPKDGESTLGYELRSRRIRDRSGNPVLDEAAYVVGSSRVPYKVQNINDDGTVNMVPVEPGRGRRAKSNVAPRSLRPSFDGTTAPTVATPGLAPGITSFGSEIKAPLTINDLPSIDALRTMTFAQRAAEAKKIEGVYGNGIILKEVQLSASGIKGQIYDEKGRIGQVQRSFSRKADGTYNVHNDYLVLTEGRGPNGESEPNRAKGRGFASNFYSSIESWYRRAGVSTVDIMASLEDGGYTWGKSGFQWQTNSKSGLYRVLPNLEQFAIVADDRYRAETVRLRARMETLTGDAKTTAKREVVRREMQEAMTPSDVARLKQLRARFEGPKRTWPTPFQLSTFTTDAGVDVGRALMYRTTWDGVKKL